MTGPSSRGLSIPTRPESGLAEWAEKIKAIQRQVDDDEAEEQRRLEEEIMASRLARKRRSGSTNKHDPHRVPEPTETMTTMTMKTSRRHIDPPPAPITTPSLARPVQPAPRPPPFGPRTPPSLNTSAAFSRQPAAKDPTPSISRLKGRGFVASVVKASAQLEGGGRRLSDLKERWAPTEPVPSYRKSWTPTPKPEPAPPVQEHRVRKSPSSRSLRTKSSAHSLKHKSSAEARPPSPGGRPMGSSSTMISYIKPTKTGDDDATHRTPRSSSSTKPRSDAASGAPSPGKPLSHLTKDRAKRPKKKAAANTTPQAPKPTTDRPTDDAQRLVDATPLATDAQRHAPAPQKRASVADRWTSQAILTLRPPSEKKRLVGARALPGLALSRPRSISPAVPPKSPILAFPNAPSPSPPAPPAKDSVSSPTGTPPSRPSHPQRSPSNRRERIPSTGSRARVMDVAQMLHETSLQSNSTSPEAPSRRDVLVASPLERRRSSFEVFGSLPVLEEARTPAGTMSRRTGATPLGLLEDSPEPGQMVTISHDEDGPVPDVDVAALASARKPKSSAYSPESILTISVEVLAITGATATPLPPTDSATFYDTEVLSVVHRYKSKSKSNGGLVDTKVWAWYGRKSSPGELEIAKLSGLARRYGVKLEEVRQGAEKEEFVGVLGGLLALRQGSRQHWSAENTTMHVVRSLPGSSKTVILDELDLSIANLCSGFPYVLTLLGSSYIWHGRGSLQAERAVARVYARGLGGENAEVVELYEGEDEGDEAELFWMMLGKREYARAEYWKFRGEEEGGEEKGARAWKVGEGGQLVGVRSFAEETAVQGTVYLLDCFWEVFVMVGKDAREKRRDIRFALSAAEALSRYVSPNRPFSPPVHALVLPSRIPADLRFHFRALDEDTLNNGDTPDHMNLLPTHEAVEHLERKSWHRHELSDESMLPLGIHPFNLNLS